MPHIVAKRRYTFRRRRLWVPSKAPAAPSFSAYWAGGINVIWQNGITSMKKNVASQKIGAQLVSATDGSAFTGSVTVYVTGDAGTQAVGSVGSGACTHEGNGYHTYAPAQAETNYDLIAFTFTGTGAIPVTIQVYTSFPQTGDSYAEVSSGTYGLSQIKTQTAAIEVDTQDIQSRLPAALVGGRMDANTSAIGGSTTPVTNIGTVFNTDFATNYNTTIDMWNVNVENWNTTAVPAEHTAGYPIVTVKDGTGTGEINTNAGAIALVDLVTTTTTATNVTTVNGLAAGVITAAAIATGAVDADALAADAVAEIADGVWDEALSGHLTAGSTGNALNAAGSAGDPWSTSLPGAYGAGSAGYIIGTNLNATISSRSSHSASDVWASGTRTLTALDEDSTTLDLDATIRAAVGMASANLDTQLDALPTAAENTTAVWAAGTRTLTTTFPTNFGSMVISAGGAVSADVVAVSGDTTAADNLESYLDGTHFMPVDAHKPVFSISGATLTVKRPDGTTTAYTRTLTTNASADPVTGSS